MALRALSRRRFRLPQSNYSKGRSVSTGSRDLAVQNVAAEYTHDGLPSLQEGPFKLPSLRDPLPGVEQLSCLPDFTSPAETIITALSNGLRIGSQNSTGPCVSVGLLIDSGCIHEDSNCYGLTHLLEKMAFNSTKNRSQAQLVQEMQAIGANVTVSSARDQMIYTGHGIKTFMPQIVEILIDSVRNALFEESEVREQLMKMKKEAEEMEKNPQSLLLNSLHVVGYSGDYSRSFFASESSLATLSGKTLREFVDKNFTAPRMVLSASGVDHHDFLAIAEPLFSDLPKVPSPSLPKFEYVGGDWRKPEESPSTHFALAFEVPNGWRNEELANRLTVLKFLLGGGESFSIGGPGKGMYTRFYRDVLNKFEQFQSITAFSSIYNDTGLFGVHACTDSQFVSRAVDIACKELTSIATQGRVTEQEFQRAKNATISSVLMSLESKAVVAEDIAGQILSYGHRRPVSEFITEVRNLTLQDLQRAASEIFSTPLTMVSWGAVDGVPTYSNMEKRFRC